MTKVTYESIKNLSQEQLDKIAKEQNKYFAKDTVRIVRINGIDIGFYHLFFIAGRLTLEYYLFKENQNKGLGTEFVRIVTELAGLEYANYDTLYLLILPENIASLKVAQRNGYTTNCNDWEFREMINEEMYNYHLYLKPNAFYNKDNFKALKKDYKV